VNLLDSTTLQRLLLSIQDMVPKMVGLLYKFGVKTFWTTMSTLVVTSVLYQYKLTLLTVDTWFAMLLPQLWLKSQFLSLFLWTNSRTQEMTLIIGTIMLLRSPCLCLITDPILVATKFLLKVETWILSVIIALITPMILSATLKILPRCQWKLLIQLRLTALLPEIFMPWTLPTLR